MAHLCFLPAFMLLCRALILVGCIGLFSSAAYAQNLSRATVSGQLSNVAGKPVEFATTVLLRADSSMVKAAVTDTAGRYAFEGIVPGTYHVVATMVGYQKSSSAPLTINNGQLTVEVPMLTVREDSRTLSEANVTARKPFIEQLPDKTVINVENSIVASGGTALEVLERAPGVLVDSQNDRITLKGREGTLVMIDGKPTYLSAQEVVNLLRNTPSNSLETIELITNPSAKYDAAGNAGIINIRLKRGSRAGGTNGSATVGGGYGRFPKATTGLTLNHRTGALSVFGNYNYDYRESFGSVDARRTFSKGDSLTTVRNLGYRPNTGRIHTVKAGGEYAFGKRTTFGLMLNGLLSDNDAQIDNSNLVYNAKGDLQQNVAFLNTSTRAMQRLSANGNVKHSFDTLGRELTVDVDVSRVMIQPQDNMQTRYLNPANQETQPALIQRNLPPSTVTIRSAKADYVHPLGKGTKMEAGGKISYVTSDNDVRFETQTETGYVPDTQRTNHFLYDETITAGYVNASREQGKWSLQAGLRAEHTRSLGNSVTLAKLVDRSYLNVFPSAFVTYNASPDHQWRASYSRRIDRPNYQDLNPFIYVMDPYTYREGNPFLRPQYTNAFQVGYTYKNETSISLSYNHTTDVITGVNDQTGQVLRVTTVNLAALDNVNLSIGMPIKPTKSWTIRPGVDVYWNGYNAQYGGLKLDYRRVSANLTINQTLLLPHGFTAELSGFYNLPTIYGQLHFSSLGQLSAGLQKSLWNKAASLKLNVSDLFYTLRPTGIINYGPTNLTFTNRSESRVARLTFTWNFGNQKLKTTRQHRSGVEDEQGRIGG
jgi:outer membrane receptor protein involved in Fe transport